MKLMIESFESKINEFEKETDSVGLLKESLKVS